MKSGLFFLLILFFTTLEVYSQERVLMPGKVLNYEVVLENVRVNNVTTRKYTTSNSAGLFTINTRPGDTIVFSHIGMIDLIEFITPEHLEMDLAIFHMETLSNELEEVYIDDASRITAVNQGIIPKEIEKLSVNERKLKTAGDFKPIHLLAILGGGLQIDPILNAISGRTKMLKRNIIIEKRIEMISFLERNYTAYMMENLEINDYEVNRFIDFLVEKKGIEPVLKSENSGRIELFILEHWNSYKGSD